MRGSWRGRVAALLVVLGAAVVSAQQASPPPGAQEPPPVTFRADVNYVEVDAVVTTVDGRVVTDLTQSDFQIVEDGRPQTIAAFSFVDLPVVPPVVPVLGGAAVEPDVRSNTNAEGRIYVLVLDDLHTTLANTPRVKQFLRDFVEKHFGTNDLAAVVHTSGRATASQEFTNSRRLLLEAIDRFTGRRLRSEALEIADALNTTMVDPSDERSLSRLDPTQAERASRARTTLTMIRDLAQLMEGIRGRRKSMLLVSEGISYDIDDVFTNTSAGIILREARDATAAATRANVAIYAVDPRGLSALGESIEASGTPPEFAGRFTVTGSLQDALRRSQQALRVLASETGGFAAVDRNDFSETFARIVRENSAYYVLGYAPTNDRRDGRFRRIEVRVTRPGLQVRARRGYVAPRGRAPGVRTAAGSAATPLGLAVTAAMNSPVPVTSIPLSVSAAAYKGAAPNASIALAVEMRADAFGFVEKSGTFLDRVEVGLSTVDGSGANRPGDRHVLEMEMTRATVDAARSRGLRFVSEMALPPGRYQLRVAAAEEGAGLSGSAFFDLEVPDFEKSRFSMSGVMLAAASAQALPTVTPKSPLGDALPAPPTTLRTFDPGDTIALYAEFYQGPGAARPVDLTTTVRGEDDRVVFENRDERLPAELQGARGGYGYLVQIPLADFASGLYVVHVEGRVRGEDTGIGRDVLIRIR